MQNLRLIKGRIKSAKNIAQITKAMELVSASKMKKAQAAAEAGKLYAETIHDMVMTLGSKVDTTSHPLLAKRLVTGGKTLHVLISTNKGLAGSLNSSLFRFTSSRLDTGKQDFVTVGQKGAFFMSTMGHNVVADFSTSSSAVSVVPALTELVMREFMTDRYQRVVVAYSQFVSVLKQQPIMKQILPLSIDNAPATQTTDSTANFLVEPDPEAVFETLLPHYVENQVRDAILQAQASEHAARMVAMRNATDNAKSFIADLTLIYNKARQEKITYEISDLVTARAALMN